ncbi:hypothetical protein MASR1M59_27580 [Melaminivora sp.]
MHQLGVLLGQRADQHGAGLLILAHTVELLLQGVKLCAQLLLGAGTGLGGCRCWRSLGGGGGGSLRRISLRALCTT